MMSSTTVLQIASQEPSLGQLLTRAIQVPCYRSHVMLARDMVKCILYLALGPTGDEHVPAAKRQASRVAALEWAFERLSVLNQDKVQSEVHFLDTPESSPRAHVHMMTDLGFGKSTLSATVIASLVEQFTKKLDKLEAIIENTGLLHDIEGETSSNAPNFKLTTAAYCSMLHSVSLKCVSLMDNGTVAKPLLERLASSTTRSRITNFKFSHDSAANSADPPNSNLDRCICGLANDFVKKLFAQGAKHFDNYLSPSAQATLLYKCPTASSLELRRIVRQYLLKPLASKPQVALLLQNVINGGIKYPSVFLQFCAYLSHLIQASNHPALCRLYYIANASMIARLLVSKIGDRRPDLTPSSFWPSPLASLLMTPPETVHHYKIANQTIQAAMQGSSKLGPPSALVLRQIWFTLLAFYDWIEEAYYILGKLPQSGEDKVDVARFIVFHAHPTLSDRNASESSSLLLNYALRIQTYYAGKGDDPDLVREVLEKSDAFVHPLLLSCFNPKLGNINLFTHVIDSIINQPTSSAPSLGLAQIVECIERLASSLSPPALSSIVTAIRLAVPSSTAYQEDLESRFKRLQESGLS